MTALPIRLVFAFVGGCVVALGLALLGASLANVWGQKNAEEDLLAVPVELLYNYSRADLAEILGEPRFGLPEIEDEVPLSLPPPTSQREVRGFVMLEVSVDSDGRPIDAKVVAGAPTGVYEEQAVQQALALQYSAGEPGRRQQVIRFSLPADDPLLKKQP
ncbi:MAG: energy transducer TonB [Pseudomonadota bacterium]